MRTPTEVYNYYRSLSKAFDARYCARAKYHHPSTNGDPTFVHNWGNAQAVAAYDRLRAIDSWLYRRERREYRNAEHARHDAKFRPYWCQYCHAK